MAIPVSSSPDYIRQELLPQITDEQLWERVTRGLFESKDRHHLWRLETDTRFSQLTEDELKKSCSAWTDFGARWLQQITFDIDFAINLFEPCEWDPCILQDYLHLLAHTLKLFQGSTAGLGKVQSYSRKQWPKSVPIRESPSAKFIQWRTQANAHFANLVQIVEDHDIRNWDGKKLRMNIQEGDKIPALTVYEMLIQNEIKKKQSEIVQRPMDTIQQHAENVGSWDFTEATKVITDIGARFKEVYTQTQKDFQEHYGTTPQDGYWHSRTITVVADADSGIVVTGGTQPAVPVHFPILKDAAASITRIRVGEKFGSIVEKCSKDVWCKLPGPTRTKIRGVDSTTEGPPELHRLHDRIVNPDKNSVASYRKIPKSTNGIGSWSFGKDFNMKPPCTRCQGVYSEWDKHLTPQTWKEKLNMLKQDCASGSLKYYAGKTYPCNYCGETVAAAKFYALCNGTLTLTLGKDLDKIKASDVLASGD